MFCPKCGNRLDDGAQFCGNCGTQINVAQNVNSVGQNFAAGQSVAGNSNKVAIIAGSIIGGAVLVAVIAIVVASLILNGNNQNLGSIGGGSFSHSVYDEVIQEYNTVFAQSKSFIYTTDQGSDAGNRLTQSIYSTLRNNGFNYLPIAGELPTKYSYIDMNEDGIDELVVFGQCCILSVYSYDSDTQKITFKEDIHGHKGNFSMKHSCYDKINNEGKILYCYCPSFTANIACFYVYSMEGDEFNQIESLTIQYGLTNSTRTYLDGSVQTSNDNNFYHNEIKSLEETYGDDPDREWFTFDGNNTKTAPKVNDWFFAGRTTYTGKITYYTQEEAMRNNGFDEDFIKKYKSANNPGYYLLELDTPVVINAISDDGHTYRNREVKAIALNVSYNDRVEEAGEYSILEDCVHYKGQRCIVSIDRFHYPTQYYGVPLDVFGDKFKIKLAE